MTPEPDRPRDRAPAAHLALYAAVAGCLALTPGVHRLHTSDSLVPVLVSLYAWEPFFWFQDRVGMLWPLLAAPLTNPLANLIAQTAAVAFCTLAAPLLLGLLLFRRRATAPLAAGLVNVWYLAAGPHLFVQCHLVTSYHGTAAAVGMAGLLLIRPRGGWWRVVTAAVLLAVAHWVYVAVVFFLLPVAVARGWLNPGRPDARPWVVRPVTDRRSVLGVLATLVGFGVGWGVMALAPCFMTVGTYTKTGTSSPYYWLGTLHALFVRSTDPPGSGLWLGGVAVAGVVGLIAVARTRHRTGWAAAAAAGLFAVGAGEVAIMVTREWSVVNLFHPRYILGAVVGWQLAAAVLLAAPCTAYLGGRGRWGVLAAVAAGLVAVMIGRFGTPSVPAVRAVYDERYAGYTRDIVAAHADVLAGEYWTVWAAVLHVNLARYERGEPPVLGWAMRGRAWRERWVPPPGDIMVAVPREQLRFVEPEMFPYTLTPAGEVDNVELYRLRPPPDPEPPAAPRRRHP